jgi:hypothetical protein
MVITSMTPSPPPRDDGPEPASLPRPSPDVGDDPITGEELLGDLDPNWLVWSADLQEH